MKTAINCDLHDYLEIACIYKIQVSLLLTDGSFYKGTPVTTSFNHEREECLVFLPTFSNEQVSIPLYLLEKMEAARNNIHFKTVIFQKAR